MDSPLRYSTTFLAMPPVSRNSCGLKEPLEGFFLGFCFIIGLLGVLRYWGSGASSTLSKTPSQNCAKQNTLPAGEVYARWCPAGLLPINCDTLRCRIERVVYDFKEILMSHARIPTIRKAFLCAALPLLSLALSL